MCVCVISADDDRRVKLRPLAGHPDCQGDYINASYVDVSEFSSHYTLSTNLILPLLPLFPSLSPSLPPSLPPSPPPSPTPSPTLCRATPQLRDSSPLKVDHNKLQQSPHTP